LFRFVAHLALVAGFGGKQPPIQGIAEVRFHGGNGSGFICLFKRFNDRAMFPDNLSRSAWNAHGRIKTFSAQQSFNFA
jgi:hypothetical protein